MNICFFADSFTKIGGAEWQTWLIAQEFAKLGHSVIFVGLKDPVEHLKSGMTEDVLLISIPKRYHVLRRLLFVAEILKEKKISICYIRSIRYLYSLGFLCSLKKIPFVFYFYHLLFCMRSWPKEYTAIHKQISGYKVYLKYIIKNMIMKFNRKILNKASGVIVQTVDQQKLLFKNFGLKSTVIPNMLPVLKPQTNSNPAGKKNVLWIGKQHKRPEIFLDLASSLKDREDTRFILVCRLNKNSKNYGQIHKKIKEAENVNHYEWVPRERIYDLFKSAYLYVTTSYMEGFPNTFLEAWSSLTPIVSLHINPDNVLVDKRAGVYSGKFENLVKDVEYLLDNPDKRKDVAQKGWSYVKKYHDPGNIIKDYESFFKSVLFNYHPL